MSRDELRYWVRRVYRSADISQAVIWNGLGTSPLFLISTILATPCVNHRFNMLFILQKKGIHNNSLSCTAYRHVASSGACLQKMSPPPWRGLDWIMSSLLCYPFWKLYGLDDRAAAQLLVTRKTETESMLAEIFTEICNFFVYYMHYGVHACEIAYVEFALRSPSSNRYKLMYVWYDSYQCALVVRSVNNNIHAGHWAERERAINFQWSG